MKTNNLSDQAKISRKKVRRHKYKTLSEESTTSIG
jgi:hypothetical protein